MKKLAFDSSNWKLIGTINDLIDLVNSQQEAIEKLESKVWTADFIEKYRPALENLAKTDDKPYKIIEMNPSELSQLLDTHRTVTLRIPKDMTVGEVLWYLWADFYTRHETSTLSLAIWLLTMSDTDLQAEIDKLGKRDEVQPNE